MEEEEDSKGFKGREFARRLNFSEAHYEEACKKIDSPDNTNQLLMALIDVGRRNDTCCDPTPDQAPQQQQQVAGRSQYVNFISSSSPSTNSAHKSSSSSGYSSITSLPSSSDQSLESLQQQPVALRKIYIDGPNVARSHGKDASFSWRGIELAVEWFLSRHHRVKVFVPEDRCQQADHDSRGILEWLHRIDVLVRTPSGCNDDLFVIEAARHNNGVIVSNDLFRNEKRLNELQRFIHLNRLPYVFVDDLFLPANDPRGRAGPMLADFLRDKPEVPSVHGKLYGAKSHQRYQRNGSVKQRHNPHASEHQRLSLKPTRSLPIGQNRNPQMNDTS